MNSDAWNFILKIKTNDKNHQPYTTLWAWLILFIYFIAFGFFPFEIFLLLLLLLLLVLLLLFFSINRTGDGVEEIFVNWLMPFFNLLIASMGSSNASTNGMATITESIRIERKFWNADNSSKYGGIFNETIVIVIR